MVAKPRRRALFLVNRNARRGNEKIDEAARTLTAYGFDLVERPSRLAEMTKTIRRYRGKVALVIIGGGDGTLNSALDGLVQTKLPLGILPLGTANDLAKTLGIGPTLSEACAVIAAGRKRRIDIGCVNGKYFLNEAGCGLSKRLARFLRKGDKSLFGVLAVAVQGLRALQSAHPFDAEVRCDDTVRKIRTTHLMVGNGKNFGGVIKNNDALIDDGKMDLYSLEIDQPWEVLKALPDVVRGNFIDSSVVRLMQGRRFEVLTERPLAVDTDGELTTHTPAEFRVLPRAVAVCVPAGRP